MAEIKTYPLLRHLRAEPSSHVLGYRGGTLRREGPGQTIWFRAINSAIAEVPIDDRELPFLFHARSSDFQELTVQGAVTYRVADPKRVARRIDFAIDLDTGRWTQTPLEQLAGLVMQLAQQFVIDELAKSDLRQILAGGVAPIRGHIAAGLAAEPALGDLGIEVVAVRVAAVAPTAEMEKALRQPTRELIQQDADQATFHRRAQAVEKERAIAENELQNRIELARREEDLVVGEGANGRRRAEEEAAAAMVQAQGNDEREALAAAREALTIDQVQGAQLKINAETAKIDAAMPADVLFALAVRELAGQLGQIEHLTITPDMLTPVLARADGRSGMTLVPRCVLVERSTEFRDLLARHGTREQARFFLAQRDIVIDEVEERHLRYEETRAQVIGAIPATWRTATVQRGDLDRFLFADDDIVVVLGQDGLVANVAKYLDGHPVIGLNPELERVSGVLVTQRPAALADLCADLVAGRASVQERTMVRASLDDGQEIRALNEIFSGTAAINRPAMS